jgi:glycosyltransferase involved in cell wall biosynthesis
METWTLEVARVLVRSGHKVVVYTPKLRGHETDEVMDGIQVRRFGPSALVSTFDELNPYPYLSRLPILSIWLPIRLIKERQFDAVLTTYVSLGFIGLLLRLFRVPTWAIIHGFYEPSAAIESHGVLRGLLRAGVQNLVLKIPVRGYIVVGKGVRAALVRRGVSQSRVVLIRGGVNLDEIDAVHVERSVSPQICFVSRMIPERRLDELLRAFMLVLKSIPNAELMVVGDGPSRQQCEDLARSLKIDGSVKFTGALFGKAKIEILKKSHLLAHPSTREGMSLTIFEALACATPVVAYDIPEIREQLELSEGGILVAPHDIEGLAQAITRLLTGSGTRAKMSASGLTAVRGLDWSSVAGQLERLIGTGNSTAA